MFPPLTTSQVNHIGQSHPLLLPASQYKGSEGRVLGTPRVQLYLSPLFTVEARWNCRSTSLKRKNLIFHVQIQLGSHAQWAWSRSLILSRAVYSPPTTAAFPPVRSSHCCAHQSPVINSMTFWQTTDQGFFCLLFPSSVCRASWTGAEDSILLNLLTPHIWPEFFFSTFGKRVLTFTLFQHCCVLGILC